MLALLMALILISSPAHVDVNEEFNVSVIVENANDLAAFQIDVSFQNLELVSVEKGKDIENWSIFDYSFIESKKIRVIAAKMIEEDSIDEGEILKLRFRFKGDAKIEFDGILSRSNGVMIPSEFEDRVIEITEEEMPSPTVTETIEERSGFEKFSGGYLVYSMIFISILALLLIWMKFIRKRG